MLSPVGCPPCRGTSGESCGHASITAAAVRREDGEPRGERRPGRSTAQAAVSVVVTGGAGGGGGGGGGDFFFFSFACVAGGGACVGLRRGRRRRRRRAVVRRRRVRAAAVLPLAVPVLVRRIRVRQQEVARRLVLERLLHEEAPDLRRERPAGDRDAVHVGHRNLALLVAHPDRRLELRRVAAEPGVVVILRRAGLAGRGPPEVRGDAGPGEDVLLEDARHLVRNTRRNHLLLLRPAPAGLRVRGSLRQDDLRDGHRLRVEAARGERRIGRRHVERRHRDRAETDRRDVAHDAPLREGVRTPSLRRHRSDVVGPDVHRQARVDGVVGLQRRVRHRLAADCTTSCRRPRRARACPGNTGRCCSRSGADR